MPLTTASATQLTSEAFLGVLELHPIAIGMDGKGRWRDKAFAKHHWRSVKYEEVYLKAYESIREARVSLAPYFDVYNNDRRHPALDRQTPWQADAGVSLGQAAGSTRRTIHLKIRRFCPRVGVHLTARLSRSGEILPCPCVHLVVSLPGELKLRFMVESASFSSLVARSLLLLEITPRNASWSTNPVNFTEGIFRDAQMKEPDRETVRRYNHSLPTPAEDLR